MHTNTASCSQHAAFKAHTPHAAVCKCAARRLYCARQHHLQQRCLRPFHSQTSRARLYDRKISSLVFAGTLESGNCALVVGATGGVGQVLTGKLLDRGFKVKALSRNPEKASSLFGSAQNLELVQGDCRGGGELQKIFAGVDVVVCVLGTTAFPSAR
ncbi:TPA: hypothetical protein ACH3X2_005926 [Trebouxia sp. C0005]